VDLRYSESDQAFRAELRAWLEDAVPAHGATPSRHDWNARRAYDTGWQRKLFDAGYAGINWPKEYGGLDLPLSEQLVYYEEIARAKAPYVGVNFVGLLHGGPTVIAEGTPDQLKQRVGGDRIEVDVHDLADVPAAVEALRPLCADDCKVR